MKRIFPINILVNGPTWRNYSNYLTWINTQIISLKDYLEYFQRSFRILNQDISNSQTVIKGSSSNINLWQRTTDELFESVIIYDKDTSKVLAKRYLIQPQFLKWKEGIYNPFYETLVVYNMSQSALTTNKQAWMSEDLSAAYYIEKGDLNNNISDGYIGYLPSSFTIFARKWSHTKTHAYDTNEPLAPSHYMQVSQSFASLYQLKGDKGSIAGQYLKEGPGETGTEIPFSFELSPSRYFISVEGQDNWNVGGTQWHLANMTFSGGPEATIQIKSSKNTVWINSYPIIPETHFRTGSDGEYKYERFVFDRSWETSEQNIENQRIINYIINSNIEDGAETKNWNNVSIVLV